MTKRDKLLNMSMYDMLLKMQNNMCRLKAIKGHQFCILDTLECIENPCTYKSCEKCIEAYLNKKE